MDILGFSVIIPAFPNLVEYYQTTYLMITLGSTLFALLGLFSTPILGAISDKYWRKPVLLVSVLFTFFSYIIVALSGHVRVYLIARMVSGLAAGNIWAIQSILSDISSDHRERIANFGFFGVVFGVGFIIGPALWWWLLGYGLKVPFFVSVFLSGLNLLFVIFGLPETNKLLDKAKKVTINIFRVFKDIFVSSEKKYYLIFFLVNLGIMIYQMSFILFLSKRFGIWWEISGYVMALFGVIMIVNQWFLLKGFWLKRFSDKKLLSISLLGMAICYFVAFLLPFSVPIIILVALSWLFQWIFRPVFQNMMLGNRQDVWVVNGNASAIVNLSEIFWPVLGGYLIDIWTSPFGLVALLIFLAYVYAKKHLATKIV